MSAQSALGIRIDMNSRKRIPILAACLAACLATAAAAAPAQASAAAGGVDIGLASSLIASGGGPGSYSTIRAFDAMVGPNAVLAQEQKLAAQYGQPAADQFVQMFDYAISDAWRLAGEDNVVMPAATESGGAALAEELTQAGTGTSGTFHDGRFFDRLFGSQIAAQIMTDLDRHFGAGSSAKFESMSGLFFEGLG